MFLVLIWFKFLSILGYTFGNVLVDGLTVTPSKFFEPCGADYNNKPESLENPPIQTTASSTPPEIRNCDSLHENSEITNDLARESNGTSEAVSTEILINSVAGDSSDAQNCCHSNEKEGGLETEANDAKETKISQLLVFSRKHIPQLEVNMLDLIGHHDTNTGGYFPNSCKFVMVKEAGSVFLAFPPYS